MTLAVDILGEATDPWGNTFMGFQGTTTISRKEFGLGWNQILESGGVLVGEEVEITLDVSASKAE